MNSTVELPRIGHVISFAGSDFQEVLNQGPKIVQAIKDHGVIVVRDMEMTPA
jgi:hypothetical protein